MSNLNINITEGQKKRYTINNDESKVLEFNPTDLGILSRLEDVEPEILKKIDEFGELQDKADANDAEQLKLLAKALKELDSFIRERIDYLFDTNVSEICAPSGTMVDPVAGTMRFAYLIDIFSEIFTSETSEAIKKQNNQIKKHTAKYVKK